MLGHDLAVGDYIAIGMNLGQTACTRVGKVVEIVEDKEKIRVEWLIGLGTSYLQNRNKATLVMSHKGSRNGEPLATFVIIPEDRVPEDYR